MCRFVSGETAAMRSCNKFVKASRSGGRYLTWMAPGALLSSILAGNFAGPRPAEESPAKRICCAVQVASMRLRVHKEQNALGQLLREEVPSCAGCEARKNSHSQILILCGALFLAAVGVRCQENVKQNDESKPTDTAFRSEDKAGSTLKICLRLPDESPFLASTVIRVVPRNQNGKAEITGVPTEVEGEMVFRNVPSGSYRIEASAPGFVSALLDSEIGTAHGQRTIFLVMKPDLQAGKKSRIQIISNTTNAAVDPTSSWMPAAIDQVIPPVEAGTACSLPELLKGTTQQMNRFVNNLEKFTALERVEHFPVSNSLRLAKPEVRKFEYVVTIHHNPSGSFILDEFRNGSDDRSQLPANIATEGLPAMALLFHPMLVNDFNFVCEGMGQWHDRPAWQVHYIQKPGKASRLRAYVTSKVVVHVALKGRVWIDPGSFQVLRLESELVEPVKEIELLNDRSTIEYMPVQFQSQKEQIWLPNIAEIYVQRSDHRYYRRLTFSDFKLFNVDTSQNVHSPKEFYSFTNSSGKEVTGTFTVVPSNGGLSGAVSVSLTIPPGASIRKFVGMGNDLNLPADQVESATFVHQGEEGAVKVDAHLSKESSLDVISQTPEGANP
jgi:hypothetical protein